MISPGSKKPISKKNRYLPILRFPRSSQRCRRPERRRQRLHGTDGRKPHPVRLLARSGCFGRAIRGSRQVQTGRLSSSSAPEPLQSSYCDRRSTHSSGERFAIRRPQSLGRSSRERDNER
jgi:hypothetical protein